MKKLGLMIAAFVIIAVPSVANAQSIVIGGGHQQGSGGHHQGARAQVHGDRHGDRGYNRGHRGLGDKVVIIKKEASSSPLTYSRMALQGAILRWESASKAAEK